MNKDYYECPKCGKKFRKDNHYELIIGMENNIAMLTGCKTVIRDMCMSCGHVELKKEKEA